MKHSVICSCSIDIKWNYTTIINLSNIHIETGWRQQMMCGQPMPDCFCHPPVGKGLGRLPPPPPVTLRERTFSSALYTRDDPYNLHVDILSRIYWWTTSTPGCQTQGRWLPPPTFWGNPALTSTSFDPDFDIHHSLWLVQTISMVSHRYEGDHDALQPLCHVQFLFVVTTCLATILVLTTHLTTLPMIQTLLLE